MTQRDKKRIDQSSRAFVRRWRATVQNDLDNGAPLSQWISFCFRCGWIAGSEFARKIEPEETEAKR